MKKNQMPPEKTSRLKLQPIRKKSISDDIVQQIISLISKGDLKAGQRLPSERELCIRFGAGRSSLREALRCLSIMGVLTARVGEGTSVAMDGSKFMETILQWRLSTEQHDIEDLMEVRIALEGVTAASAARNSADEDIEKLRDLVARMEVAVGDSKRFAALDLDFHLSLARTSNNNLILDLVSLIRGQLERGVAKVLLFPQAMPLSVKEHKAILQAIIKRDPEAARAAMQTHLNAAILRHRNAMKTPAK